MCSIKINEKCVKEIRVKTELSVLYYCQSTSRNLFLARFPTVIRVSCPLISKTKMALQRNEEYDRNLTMNPEHNGTDARHHCDSLPWENRGKETACSRIRTPGFSRNERATRLRTPRSRLGAEWLVTESWESAGARIRNSVHEPADGFGIRPTCYPRDRHARCHHPRLPYIR